MAGAASPTGTPGAPARPGCIGEPLDEEDLGDMSAGVTGDGRQHGISDTDEAALGARFAPLLLHDSAETTSPRAPTVHRPHHAALDARRAAARTARSWLPTR